MARRTQNVAKERAERFRFVVRSSVPIRGFGFAGDDLDKWLRERFGNEGHVVIPSDYKGTHSIAVYIDDASAIPELVALLDRITEARGGPGTLPA